ncbi:MAG: hypothetical protein ACUVRV_05075 [Cyanobacteriota bacterium]
MSRKEKLKILYSEPVTVSLFCSQPDPVHHHWGYGSGVAVLR